MIFNATLNNVSAISWLSILLVEETGEHYRPVVCHWQSLSHNVVSSIPRHQFELTTLVVIGTDCTGSCKSNYHTCIEPAIVIVIKCIYIIFVQIVVFKYSIRIYFSMCVYICRPIEIRDLSPWQGKWRSIFYQAYDRFKTA